MLNHQNTSIAYLSFLLIIILAGGLATTSGFVILIVITIVYIVLMAVGSAVIQKNYYLKAINRGRRDEAKVALTFDDGPDENTTPAILEILEKHKVKAAFFVIGSKIEKNRRVLKLISDKGHLIGNHSWSHSSLFDFFLPRRMADEIDKTGNLIEDVTGEKPEFFRPPFGVTNPFLAKAIKRTGYKVMGWSLRTFDTTKGKEFILRKIETKLSNGDIILLHDTKPETVELLEDAISIIKNKGFEIVRADEMF